MGFYPYGEGFTFDDKAKGATPVAEMNRIIRERPEEASGIVPYLGGDEFLDDPQQLHRRYAIWFDELSEPEARSRYPTLMNIVDNKVKPERIRNKHKSLREEWWLYGRRRPALQKAIVGRSRILMHPYVSTYVAYAFVPATTFVASPHYALALSSFSEFAALQNRVHEVWVRFFASSLEEGLTYTANIFFEPFPFPTRWHDHSGLETIGKTYYDFRAMLMVEDDEGLTKIYNRFHDPEERDQEVMKLRELHAAMDRAVLDAYGWSDIPIDCEFLLDYEINEEEWGNKKKPYRYRWPNEVRDEVLARLLELNAQRGQEEARSGAAAAKKGGKKVAKPALELLDAEDLFA
jgi:hypothetical protein